MLSLPGGSVIHKNVEYKIMGNPHKSHEITNANFGQMHK